MNKILIIEDDKNIAELERDYLQMNGFKVNIEYSGRRGFNNAIDNNYKLILLDLSLPEMDGFELCKKLREKTDIPILIVSSRREVTDKITCLSFGADDYIEKPFNPRELVARVKAHIRRYEGAFGNQEHGKEVLQLKELEIHKDTKKVFLFGKEISFTTTEYELFLFLAENPEHVFSKIEIFDKVWGEEFLGDSATVTVHIGKIRDKIEQVAKNLKYIETIWGAGYRFRLLS